MGLASFNRMRLRRIEEMKPENIETKVEVEVEEPVAKVEEPKEEIKAEPVVENEEEAPKKSTRRK